MNKLTRTLGAAITALVLAGSAHAGVVTVEFPQGPLGGIQTNNFESQGFRFSPNCHYDMANVPPNNVGMGWDQASCATTYNNDFLGPASMSGPSGNGWLYIDHGGDPFSLISANVTLVDFLTGGQWISSAGGDITTKNDTHVAPRPVQWDFSGPDWSNLQWLMVRQGGGGPNFWMDRITFGVVPEPASLALIVLALGLLFGLQRGSGPRAMHAMHGAG